MFNKEKVSKLEKEVYRLKNVLKGYQKAIRQVRSEKFLLSQECDNLKEDLHRRINHIRNMKGLPNV